MKDWLHSSDEEVKNMTFEEAKEIIEKQNCFGTQQRRVQTEETFYKSIRNYVEQSYKK